MKKYCFVLFAVFSMFAGVVAEEWVPALFRDGKPLHGFSAAEDGGICLAPKLSQWAGVSVPINRGGGHYVFTLEILPAKGEQAGAAFYLVLADGKHRMVFNTVKGGEKARRITIKYEGNVGVKGLMLKKNNKKHFSKTLNTKRSCRKNCNKQKKSKKNSFVVNSQLFTIFYFFKKRTRNKNRKNNIKQSQK